MRLMYLLLAFALGQPEPPVFPPVDVKDLVQLKATADTPVEWINPYDATEVKLLVYGQESVFQGLIAGKYRIGYYTADKTGKLSKPTWFTLTVGTRVAPGPVVNPTRPGELPFYFLIVEESQQAVGTRGQLLSSAELKRKLDATGSRLIIVDKDVKDTSVNPPVTPPVLAPWINSVKKYPTLIGIDKGGKEVYRGDVPPTAQGLIDLVIKLGG